MIKLHILTIRQTIFFKYYFFGYHFHFIFTLSVFHFPRIHVDQIINQCPPPCRPSISCVVFVDQFERVVSFDTFYFMKYPLNFNFHVNYPFGLNPVNFQYSLRLSSIGSSNNPQNPRASRLKNNSPHLSHIYPGASGTSST